MIFCIKFGERDYGQKTVIGQDEAWVLSITAYGRAPGPNQTGWPLSK